MKTSSNHENPNAIGRLENFLAPANILKWRERWRRKYPDGFRTDWLDAISFEETPILEDSDFRLEIKRILSQLMDDITQEKIQELGNGNTLSATHSEYGSAFRTILERVRESNIPSRYPDIIDELFIRTEITLNNEIGIHIAYQPEEPLYDTGETALYQLPTGRTALDSSISSANTQTGKEPRKTRGKAKLPPGGYKSLHPNPAEAIRTQFKFLNPNIWSLSDLTEDEFEEFVRITEAMIHQNMTIDVVGQFKKAVNSVITYNILTYASSDLKKTLYNKTRPPFYITSMANLFGFETGRFYQDMSEGALKEFWEKTFPLYEIIH